jgi:hypothetical protein
LVQAVLLAVHQDFKVEQQYLVDLLQVAGQVVVVALLQHV